MGQSAALATSGGHDGSWHRGAYWRLVHGCSPSRSVLQAHHYEGFERRVLAFSGPGIMRARHFESMLLTGGDLMVNAKSNDKTFLGHRVGCAFACFETIAAASHCISKLDQLRDSRLGPIELNAIRVFYSKQFRGIDHNRYYRNRTERKRGDRNRPLISSCVLSVCSCRDIGEGQYHCRVWTGI